MKFIALKLNLFPQFEEVYDGPWRLSAGGRFSSAIGREDHRLTIVTMKRQTSVLQICGQPETVGVRVPIPRLLVVACEHDWRSIQLTRSVPRERRRRSVDAALRQYDRAAIRRELPDVCQRQCHQILRHASSE